MAKLVNKAGRGILAVAMFAAATSCTHPSAREHARITHLAAIQLHSGINKVEMLASDGRAGMIVVGTREEQAGHPATVYLVMLPDEAGSGWNIVTTGQPGVDLTADGATTAVRFAKAWVDSTPDTLLFTATRAPDQPGQGPCAYVIDTWRLVTGRKGEAPSGFERVSETKTNVNYSTPDAALQGEIGLP
jgi:hypothetical protein